MRISMIAAAAFFLMACSGGGDTNLQNEPSTSSISPGDSFDTSEANGSDQGEDVELASESLPKADMATNFTMTTLSGEEVTLESLRGRHVLVNFWATWCVPCRKEMPYLQALSDEHAEQLVVLGVNIREDAERIQPFIDKLGMTFPILLDPPNVLLKEHNVRGLPVSYVVGPEGAIVYRRIGEILPEEFDPWLDDNLLAANQ